MKAKELMDIIQSLTDGEKEKDVFIFHDEYEDPGNVHVVYDTTQEILVIRNYD